MAGNKFGIALKIKAKHGYVFNYMLSNNLTLDELAEKTKISKCTLMKIIHFKWQPTLGKNGKGNYATKGVAKKLVDFFQCSIEDLFPNILCEHIKNNTEIAKTLQNSQIIKHEVDLEYLPFNQIPQLGYTPDYDSLIDNPKIISELLSGLTPKEEKVIRMRFGIGVDEEHTLEKTGRHFSITRTRVSQLEDKALRKLREKTKELNLRV